MANMLQNNNGFSKHTIPTLKLNTGFHMPILGLGVWRLHKADIKDLIINAIKIGYRHFDCTGNADYKSERDVGEALAEAIRTGLVNREELFITTKASLITRPNYKKEIKDHISH